MMFRVLEGRGKKNFHVLWKIRFKHEFVRGRFSLRTGAHIQFYSYALSRRIASHTMALAYRKKKLKRRNLKSELLLNSIKSLDYYSV